LRYCEKEKEKKRDGGKTRRKKGGLSSILKNLRWNVKEIKKRIQSREEEMWGKKKRREKERQAAGKTRKSKRTQTPLAHHNFNVIVFVRQEARESCFLVFCFIFCKTGSAGFFHSVPAARTLGTLTFFSLLTPVGGKDLQVFLP
jgi:hypothetical protein